MCHQTYLDHNILVASEREKEIHRRREGFPSFALGSVFTKRRGLSVLFFLQHLQGKMAKDEDENDEAPHTAVVVAYRWWIVYVRLHVRLGI